MNKKQRLERQFLLLKHFEGDFYQEKKINNQWYIKTWNGNQKRWQVAVYSEQSFNLYKAFNDRKKTKCDTIISGTT